VSVALAPRTPLLRLPTEDDVVRLAGLAGYPCVSVLMPTRPGPALDRDDADRLAGLIADAHRRLVAEGLDADAVVARLAALAAAAGSGPSGEGLGLFASEGHAEAFHLTAVLGPRVVVDPTFATRDLMATVQQNPSYWLLLVSAEHARLFEHDGLALREIIDGLFPVLAGEVVPLARPAASPGPSRRQRAAVRAFGRIVDERLGSHLSLTRRPVILMAAERILGEYLNITRHGLAIVGVVQQGRRNPTLAALERDVEPVLGEHLADVEAVAGHAVDSRWHGHRVVYGLVACWREAATGRPDLLLVEQSFAMPARLSTDGLALELTLDREHPDVLDDAVDELIEVVLVRGGLVRFVPDGTLERPVAMSVLHP
jgi:hypothetical protein